MLALLSSNTERSLREQCTHAKACHPVAKHLQRGWICPAEQLLWQEASPRGSSVNHLKTKTCNSGGDRLLWCSSDYTSLVVNKHEANLWQLMTIPQEALCFGLLRKVCMLRPAIMGLVVVPGPGTEAHVYLCFWLSPGLQISRAASCSSAAWFLHTLIQLEPCSLLSTCVGYTRVTKRPAKQ